MALQDEEAGRHGGSGEALTRHHIVLQRTKTPHGQSWLCATGEDEERMHGKRTGSGAGTRGEYINFSRGICQI